MIERLFPDILPAHPEAPERPKRHRGDVYEADWRARNRAIKRQEGLIQRCATLFSLSRGAV